LPGRGGSEPGEHGRHLVFRQAYLFAAVVAQDGLDGFGQAPVIDAAIGAQVGQLPGAGALGMAHVGEALRRELVFGMEKIILTSCPLAVRGGDQLRGAVDTPGTQPPQPGGRVDIGQMDAQPGPQRKARKFDVPRFQDASVADGDRADGQLLGVAKGLPQCPADAGWAVQRPGPLGLDDQVPHAQAGQQDVHPELLQPDLLGAPIQNPCEQITQDVLGNLFRGSLANGMREQVSLPSRQETRPAGADLLNTPPLTRQLHVSHNNPPRTTFRTIWPLTMHLPDRTPQPARVSTAGRSAPARSGPASGSGSATAASRSTVTGRPRRVATVNYDAYARPGTQNPGKRTWSPKPTAHGSRSPTRHPGRPARQGDSNRQSHCAYEPSLRVAHPSRRYGRLFGGPGGRRCRAGRIVLELCLMRLGCLCWRRSPDTV
jgi:hypothetical protein